MAKRPEPVYNNIQGDVVAKKESQDDLNYHLELDYIYGYRCRDTRNNLRYTEDGKIVFSAAGVGIVMDQKNNTQRFMIEHDDDIISLTTNFNGRLCATGQVGEVPLICIWDTATMECLAQIKGPLSNAVRNLCFSFDGKYLAASGMGENQTIAVFELCRKGETAINPRLLVS